MSSQRAEIRAHCTLELLEEKKGDIDIKWMMRIARDRSTNPSIDLDVTASSCVASLPKTKGALPVFWWAASVPGVSCYIPYFVHSGSLPNIVSRPGSQGKTISAPSKVQADAFSENSLWWLFRDLADLANLDWDNRKAIIRSEFDKLEDEFINQVSALSQKATHLLNHGDTEEAAQLLSTYTNDCVEKVIQKLEELRVRFRAEKQEFDVSAFSDYIGTYEIRPGLTFEITLDGQNLFAQLTGQPNFQVYPVFKDRFEFRVAKASILFKRNEKKEVDALILFQNGQEILAQRKVSVPSIE
jgi:hypothetical protein